MKNRYYEDGTRKTMLEPESNLIAYTYDKAKRLKTVKRNSVVEGTYEYNVLGLRTKLIEGNGAYTENTYNATTRWLTGVYNKKSDGTVISSFVYTHDKVSNRTSMALANGDIVNYGYDNTYQLISEVRTGSTLYALSWSYDEVGNRLTQNKNGIITNYTCNDANQLISEVSGLTSTAYTYDPNGNLITKTVGATIYQWTYDYENRQTAYKNTLNSGSYWYDVGGRRIGHTSVMTAFKSGGSQNASSKIGVGNGKGQGLQNGKGTQNAISNQYETITTTERYIYDGANIIADYDQNNALKVTYVTPFLDQNLCIFTSASTYYYMQDGLGSVRNLVNSVSSVVNSYDYYAFGQMLSEKEEVTNRYKFTSREWDAENSTYYYRARYYMPTTGRFISIDPIEYLGGLNLYSYVNNNPVNYTDPNGQWSLTGALSTLSKGLQITRIISCSLCIGRSLRIEIKCGFDKDRICQEIKSDFMWRTVCTACFSPISLIPGTDITDWVTCNPGQPKPPPQEDPGRALCQQEWIKRHHPGPGEKPPEQEKW